MAQAQTNMSETQQRINAAVMAVYNEELARNPYDYALLYSRANQYFLNGEYLKSLEDINNALTYIPKSDESTLFESYVLRAKIYIIRNEQEKAITDLKMANTIKPVDQHTVLLHDRVYIHQTPSSLRLSCLYEGRIRDYSHLSHRR